MLIPTSYQPLTSEESVYMGVTVMGGVLSQFASSLAMMSHCKFLGIANYTIAKDTTGLLGSSVLHTNWSGLGAGLNKSSKFYSFLYGSTPLSEWVGVIFQYVATKESSSNSPIITLRVKDLSGTILSKAVVFSYPAHLSMLNEGILDIPYVGSTGSTYYEIPSGTSGTDDPRPLYIPPSNRGDMILFEIEVEDCDLISVSFFDLYQAEVTP